jgi:hypothetical protein
MDNIETIQRHIENIWHTRHRAKTNNTKKENTENKKNALNHSIRTNFVFMVILWSKAISILSP